MRLQGVMLMGHKAGAPRVMEPIYQVAAVSEADVGSFSPCSASHMFLTPLLYWSRHGSDPVTGQSKELNQSKISHTKPQ